MEIKSEDVTLSKFLEKFTFTEDPSPGTKIVLPTPDFLNIASLLKLNSNLERLIMTL